MTGGAVIFGLLEQEWLYRLAGPGCAIGLALLVLARVELNRPLVLVTIAYLAVVLVPLDFGWVIARPSQWAFLPHLILQGGVLLAAGLGFAVAQHSARQPTQ